MVRRVRSFALVMTFGLLVSACTWPMFGFGPDHTGVNPVITNVTTSNVGTFTLKGTATTGGAVSSSPALVNGVVYVGSGDGKVYAFSQYGTTNCAGSPKTCTPLWTATTGGGVGSPAVVNGVVYVGSSDGNVYAFDAAGGAATCSGTPKTCTPLWTATTGGGIVFSSPAIENGIVYIGSGDDKLYAFDAAGSTNCSGTPKTCTPLWSAPTGGPVESSPAPGGDAVYVGSDDHNVYAFGLPSEG
ncbi:MAG: PQQ-binding-like beta-propeller repeat protein [Actinobacteria bacterium]|nr:PQQ-binding-like beta-propeller repeat protein [Actinomycetota bacterium]